MGLFDDLFVGSSQQDAQRLNLENRDRILGLFGSPGDQGGGSLFGALNSQFQQALPFMQQGIEDFRTNITGAINRVPFAFEGQAEGFLDRERQLLSGMRQRMQQAGLGGAPGSSVPMTGDISRQTNLGLADLRGRQEGLISSLMAQRGTGLMAGGGNLAQMTQQHGRDIGGLGQNLGGILGSYQFQGGPSPFAQLAGPLGMAAGGLLSNSGLFGG